MQYVLAGLAVVAAVAALFFRPPHGDSTATWPAAVAPRESHEAAVARVPTVERSTTTARSAARPRVVVYVAGEVFKPGVYELAAGARAQQALARAGGAKPDADLVAVNLAALVDDGTELVFPKIGQTTPRARRSAQPRMRAGKEPHGHGRGHRAKPQIAPSHSVDLNLADASELQTLPGLGPGLAARIVAYREANGPFASVDELADVSGITPRLQEKIADFIVVR